MIDAKEVKRYIEDKNNITLDPIQYQILKAIIRGDEVYTARGVGRSLLYNGYADYLKDVVAKGNNWNIKADEFDSIFTSDMILLDPVSSSENIGLKHIYDSIKNDDEKMFEKEYQCKYQIKKAKDTSIIRKGKRKHKAINFKITS